MSQQEDNKVKLFWIRKGNEDLLVSNLWRNKANAEVECAELNRKQREIFGFKERSTKKAYKVITCILIYK